MTSASAQTPPPPSRPAQQQTPGSSKSPPRNYHYTGSQQPLTVSHLEPIGYRATADGTAGTMASRAELNGSLSNGQTNGETSRFRTASDESPDDAAGSYDEEEDRRPTSAPGRRNGSIAPETQDDIGSRVRRPTKPLLLRSKSEYGPRPVEEPEPMEEGIPEWGARHGFEDHYQSEHIISQLAHVSCPALRECAGFSSLIHDPLLTCPSELVHVLHRQATRNHRQAETITI